MVAEELKAAFQALSSTIDSCIHDPQPFNPDHIKVVMYFDESHALSDKPASSDIDGKSLMDVLCAAIDYLRSRPFFVIFLSTNSHLHRIAPSGRHARSARAREHWDALQAPITEVAFDCAPNLNVKPDELTLEETSSLEFMAQFSRPL